MRAADRARCRRAAFPAGRRRLAAAEMPLLPALRGAAPMNPQGQSGHTPTRRNLSRRATVTTRPPDRALSGPSTSPANKREGAAPGMGFASRLRTPPDGPAPGRHSGHSLMLAVSHFQTLSGWLAPFGRDGERPLPRWPTGQRRLLLWVVWLPGASFLTVPLGRAGLFPSQQKRRQGRPSCARRSGLIFALTEVTQ